MVKTSTAAQHLLAHLKGNKTVIFMEQALPEWDLFCSCDLPLSYTQTVLSKSFSDMQPRSFSSIFRSSLPHSLLPLIHGHGKRAA